MSNDLKKIQIILSKEIIKFGFPKNSSYNHGLDLPKLNHKKVFPFLQQQQRRNAGPRTTTPSLVVVFEVQVDIEVVVAFNTSSTFTQKHFTCQQTNCRMINNLIKISGFSCY